MVYFFIFLKDRWSNFRLPWPLLLLYMLSNWIPCIFFWKPVWIYMRLVLLASCIFFPGQFTKDETDLKYGEYRCVKWGRSSLQRASYRLSKRILILFSSQILNTSRIFFLERTIYFWYFYTKRKEASKLITLVYLDFFSCVFCSQLSWKWLYWKEIQSSYTSQKE